MSTLYAIFICNALARSCRSAGDNQVYATPRQCIVWMLMEYGLGQGGQTACHFNLNGKTCERDVLAVVRSPRFRGGKLYVSKNIWYECAGHQTWQPVQ